MDIIFQFGEYISESENPSFFYQALIEFVGAFLGFLFALRIFYMQIKKDRKKEEKQKLQELKEHIYYYKELIKSIIKIFNKQLELLDNYIKEQETDLLGRPNLKFVITNNFLRLIYADHKVIFEAWKTYFPSEDTIKLYDNNNNALDFIDTHYSELKRIFLENSKHNYDLLSEVRNIIDHIPDTLAMMSRHLRNSLDEKRIVDPEYRGIQIFIGVYGELIKSKASFESINIEFLYPLLNFYLENQELYNSDEIIMLCKKARVKLYNIEEEQRQSIAKYREIRPDTEKHIQELEITIKKIDDLLNKLE